MPEKGKLSISDSGLIRFAVRATIKSKFYIVEYRHEGQLYRVTLGKTNEITPVDARKKAQSILAKIANGVEENSSDAMTLEQAFILYLQQRKLKQLSIATYHHCINAFLSDWKSKPIFEYGIPLPTQRSCCNVCVEQDNK